MKQFTRRAAFALPLALFALAGCNTQPTVAHGGNMNPADLDFVTQAYNLIIFDREEATLAPTYAMTPAVKEIAAHLLADANAFAAQLDPILKEQGITPPKDLRSDLRVRLLHIRVDRGLDFDRSFIEDQIASHKEVLDRREMMMSTEGANPQLAALAQQGLDAVKENLAALRAIQRQLPPSQPVTGPFGLPPPPLPPLPALPQYK